MKNNHEFFRVETLALAALAAFGSENEAGAQGPRLHRSQGDGIL